MGDPPLSERTGGREPCMAFPHGASILAHGPLRWLRSFHALQRDRHCGPTPWLALRRGGGLPHSRDESARSEEHTSELQSLTNLVFRLLLEKNISASAQQTEATAQKEEAKDMVTKGFEKIQKWSYAKAILDFNQAIKKDLAFFFL